MANKPPAIVGVLTKTHEEFTNSLTTVNPIVTSKMSEINMAGQKLCLSHNQQYQSTVG